MHYDVTALYRVTHHIVMSCAVWMSVAPPACVLGCGDLVPLVCLQTVLRSSSSTGTSQCSKKCTMLEIWWPETADKSSRCDKSNSNSIMSVHSYLTSSLSSFVIILLAWTEWIQYCHVEPPGIDHETFGFPAQLSTGWAKGNCQLSSESSRKLRAGSIQS